MQIIRDKNTILREVKDKMISERDRAIILKYARK